MASPIVGALFLGLFTGTPNPAMPVNKLFADGQPTPQCVQCDPAKRRTLAHVYDWSNPPVRVWDPRPVHRHAPLHADDIRSGERLGMAEEQMQRLVHFAGV